MQRLKIPITSIVVEDRQRLDLGDITSLAESLSRYGLIQPIIINQDRRLIAGGRRLTAAKSLGWVEVDIVYRETLSADELHELELEENVRRKDLHWTERCLNVATIHRLKVMRNAVEGEKWGYRETGELLGMAVGRVSETLTVARELRDDPKSPMWKCEHMTAALGIIAQRLEDEAMAILAKRQQALANVPEPAAQPLTSAELNLVDILSASPEAPAAVDALARERARYYSNPLNPPDSFDEYWSNRSKWIEQARNTINLSSRVHNVDCLKFMAEIEWQYDHIITDPPYGIDVEMMDQDAGGLVDIESVKAEHQVEENRELLRRFFPLAYRVLVDNGFLVLWADQMLWQFLYDEATAAGFKVQRWPLTWIKSHTCMNNAAQYNYTKSSEIAMVCRKGNVVLAKTSPVSHIVASHDDYKETLGHPFVKPFRCWEFILDHVTSPGQRILEPFAGRGSGAISMLRMERQVTCCESNVAHYNALLENIKQYYLRLNPQFVFK